MKNYMTDQITHQMKVPRRNTSGLNPNIVIVTLVMAFVVNGLCSIKAFSLSVHPMNQQQVNELKLQLASAKIPKQADLKEKDWSCDLYGVRSRQRKEELEKFYKFKVSQSKVANLGDQVANLGDQVIKSYRFEEHGLSGYTGPIRDLIRILPSGQLIGEISIPQRKSDQNHLHPIVKSVTGEAREVIAYAVCK